VREGDGSMTVWTTSDGHHFVQRTVTLGLQNRGYDQILDGVSVGERVVVKGAIILDNMLNSGES
jgi:membrane fusion protein, heavy metal efflux system